MQAIEQITPKLTISQKCELLGLSRSSVYYQPKEANDTDVMNEIHEIYLSLPFYGYRRVTAELQVRGYVINHKRVQRLMQAMNLRALFPTKWRCKQVPYKKYPYLLEGMSITYPNHVWGTDITYIKLRNGFVYLMALVDFYSRYVVDWSMTTTLEAEPYVALLESAFKIAKPVIANSDQGVQYTSDSWTSLLESNKVQISMSGKGRCFDNILVERLWRTIKYEEVYLKSYDTVAEARSSIGAFIEFYNTKRLHQSLGYKTPASRYFGAAN